MTKISPFNDCLKNIPKIPKINNKNNIITSNEASNSNFERTTTFLTNNPSN